jgi:hypothetical protein
MPQTLRNPHRERNCGLLPRQCPAIAAPANNGMVATIIQWSQPMAISRKPPPEHNTLANLVGGIVADIREKLVEEAWFGRPLTGNNPIPHFYEIMWKPHEPVVSHEPHQTPEQDIDR